MYRAKNLHLISETPGGSLWMYDGYHEYDLSQKYFNRAWKKLRAGDFILVNLDGGGAPHGSMHHVWVSDKREVAFNPVARAFCECPACLKRRASK